MDRTSAGRAAAGALSGLLAGAVALGVAELTAAATGPRGAPVLAVGEAAMLLVRAVRGAAGWERAGLTGGAGVAGRRQVLIAGAGAAALART